MRKVSNSISNPYLLASTFGLLIGLLSGCEQTTQQNAARIEYGTWRFTLQMQNKELPFTGIFSEQDGTTVLRITNATEVVELRNPKVMGDSVIYDFPVYNASLLLIKDSPELISGKWIDSNKEDYSIPLIAEYNRDFRFTSTKSSTAVASQYKVRFQNKNSKGFDAILLLTNENGKLSGTFLTETGDFRYLEGNIMNGGIHLSTFDGSHAWLFSATINGDSLTNGHFFAGAHGHTPWIAVADSTFQLISPDSISDIKSGYAKFEFSLPDETGTLKTHDDFIDDNTVTIYQITGSWCPNCMDASITMHQIAQDLDPHKLKIVPIHFELTDDFEKAKARVNKMKRDLGLPSHFLFGGKANKQETEQQLPALSQLSSYPTLIFTDKTGTVVKVYTGFYGPGTGQYHEEFISETKALLASLLST